MDAKDIAEIENRFKCKLHKFQVATFVEIDINNTMYTVYITEENGQLSGKIACGIKFIDDIPCGKEKDQKEVVVACLEKITNYDIMPNGDNLQKTE